MKLFKILFILTLLFMVSTIGAEEVKIAADRAVMVLYVATIKMDLEHAETYSKILTNTIRTELGKSSRYKLANPETDQAVELAKNHNETCLSVEECARKEAQAVDADLVLISEVSKVESQCRISMRLERIYSKEIIKSKNLRASCSIDDMEGKVVELVYLIMKNEVASSTGKRPARITSDPPGAKVTINNEPVGITPIDLKISTGQVRILMEFEGTDRYAPILVNELVEDSQQLFIYNKVFAERNAYLVLEVTPSLSKIKVDDRLIDSGSINRIPVEIRKEHSIVVSADKHETKNINVPSLEPDQEYKVNINLAPNPCNLNLSSNPSGSDVYKDGVKVGSTPYKEQIKSGDHHYSIQKQFYDSQDVSFYCAPEETVQRALTLTRAKYTEDEQDRINKAAKWKTTSYYGFGLGLGLAALAYSKSSDFKKYDDQYKAATNPYEIESLKAKRESAKSASTTFAIGSAATIGISYLFYRWGEFPEDLKQRNSITVIPTSKGTEVAWQFSW